MLSNKQLCSGGVFLRCLQEADVSVQYLNWLRDPSVNQFLEARFSLPTELDELRQFVCKVNASEHTTMFGIFLSGGSKHIGNVKVGPIDFNHLSADIGFLIGDRNQWGKGYASIALKLAVGYAFDLLNLAKLTAGCYELNHGSRRVLLNAGFLEEGRRKAQVVACDTRQDVLVFGLVNPKYNCTGLDQK